MRNKVKLGERMRQMKLMEHAKLQFHRCPGCEKEMVRNSKEYFCPKCGLTEELVYDGA